MIEPSPGWIVKLKIGWKRVWVSAGFENDKSHRTEECQAMIILMLSLHPFIILLFRPNEFYRCGQRELSPAGLGFSKIL